MAAYRRITTSPTGQVGRGAAAWLRSLPRPAGATRTFQGDGPALFGVKNGHIMRPLGLAGVGTG